MGAWGTGVFSDDNAADVRDDYRKLVGDGLTGPQATERLIAQWAPIGDPDLEPVFWLALALTQWGCGRLEARVKEEALRMIANGSAIRAWAGGPDDGNAGPFWKPQNENWNLPNPRNARSKRARSRPANGERGDLIGYRLTTGDSVVLRMLDRHVDQGGAYPECELFDWRGPEIPATGLPDTTPVRELKGFGGGKRFMIVPLGKRSLKDRLRRLNLKHTLDESYSRVPRGKSNPTRVISWKQFDEFLELSYGIS